MNKVDWINIIIFAAIILLLAPSCKKKEPATISIIATTKVTDITATTAASGGNITSDGGASVTAHGVCWNTTEYPTIAESKTVDGTGTGQFVSNITDLATATTYHVRAYATNSVGTAYGEDITFTTNIEDVDGNSYSIIIIGSQSWSVENLRVTHYNDGSQIPNITDNSEWKFLATGAYCWFENDAASFKNTYGALYNWYVANTGKLCPIGWHVPTDAEWNTLITYLGGESSAFIKLKESGTTHWSSPNTDATNESGFTALPGGKRASFAPNGGFPEFAGMGYSGFWWSSTEDDTDNSLCMNVDNDYLIVYRWPNLKVDGLSIRCLKN
jgi:uncharacterized protein (TIGR02145 family)